MAPYLSIRDPNDSVAGQTPTNANFPQQGSIDWTAPGRYIAKIA